MTTSLDAAIGFILATLLSGLWQAPLFALVAWSALRIYPTANATTRHSVFAVALFASAVLPVVTAGVAFSHLSIAGAAANAGRAPQRHGPYNPGKSAVRIPTRTRTTDNDVRLPAAAFAFPAPSSRISFAIPQGFGLALFALWAVGAALALVRLSVGLAHLERLKRDALPLALEDRTALPRYALALKSTRNVRLCRSDEIEVPLAVGLFDAMILLPERLLAELEPSEIDSIALHELAHLRRSDDWINAFERVAQAFLFFNPGVLWLIAQLDLEREVACDDWVLQQNDALPYATCLAKVVESVAWPFRAMTAPGAFETRRGMSIRIERLLAKQRDVRVRTSLGPTGSVVAVLGMLGIVVTLISPQVAYSAVQPAAPIVPVHPSAPRAPQPPVRLRLERLAHIDGAADGEKIVAEANAPDYIEELAGAGYTKLSPDDLIAFKSLGVSATFIRDIERRGIHHPAVQELIQLRALGIDPAYIGAMRGRFGKDLDVETLLGLKALNVTGDYIDGLSAAGLENLSADEVSSLRALNVTPAYVRSLARNGQKHLSSDQLAQLKALNIDADFVARARARGFSDLSVERLLELKATGVL
jgi:beta-lactamase regulating signal transducer with metallopeptidase domain